MFSPWIAKKGFSPEALLEVAKYSERSERYEDMAAAMKLYTEMHFKDNKGELGKDERNLLSVAYKNVVGARRAAWRIISGLMKSDLPDEKAKYSEKFRAKTVEELNAICEEVLKLITEFLRPKATATESKVFYEKMQGDYYRYLAEVAGPDTKEDVVKKAFEAYNEAQEIAKELHATDPIRLGLALNFSVFYYEIKNEPENARNLAQTAFNEALSQLDSITDDTYKDSTLIMQLLRDNLTVSHFFFRYTCLISVVDDGH
ncbi:unnamed protein product [Calicophoron daubneyi]|uniref:14-3-3 domain-containing protein n=1 Tax=Calicophoron daubneyi TaxID=300641 RepID=A0AAV2TM24_CALDB